ncbi:MAG: EamA family transporter [Thermodesulfobacteriota bacterium]
MRKVKFWGYLYILIGSTLWGVSSVVAKSLFNVGLLPAELVLVRLILSTLTLLFFLLFFSSKRLFISVKDLSYFLILGLIGVAGMQYAYYFTISKIQVAPAILLQYLSLIWVSIYSYLFQKEPFSKGKIASLLLALLGCYLVVGGYQINLLRLNRIGIISGLIGSLFFAFYMLFGEKGLKKYDPWTLILYGFGFAALLFSIFISPIKIIKDGHPLKVWLAFIYISIFSTLIPFGLYLKGVECIRATRASITATWEPVVAGLMAYSVLGEVLSPLQVLGGIGVMIAIVILQMAREKSAPPAPIEVRQSTYSSECQK